MYYLQIDQALKDLEAARLSRQQVEQAWNYAYHFFFTYPLPFPWHLLDLWEKLEEWPLARLYSAVGQDEFGDTFRYLAGDQRVWAEPSNAGVQTG
jgi:hypothetical protein